ncbi:MAG: thiamine pyrophosphate-binding protein [Candidatus Heimdallarchaeota archaeon]
MIDPDELLSCLEKNFQFISGVPCSYFKDFLAALASHETETQMQHVYATREDEAIGIAAGVVFSGKKAAVYMQNSGLGNIGDALTSLAQLYKLPMLLLISYRGLEPDKDFPEHSIMGEINESLLDALKIPYWEFSEARWEVDLKQAIAKMEEISSPVALLIKKGVLSQ